MSKKQVTKNQHQIPKFLIENFSKNPVVVDTEIQKIFKTNSSKITTEKYFYESDDYEMNEIENILAQNEALVAPIIVKMANLETDNICLSIDETIALLKFWIMLSTRNVGYLQLFENRSRDIYEYHAKIDNKNQEAKEKMLNQLTDIHDADFIEMLRIHRKWYRQLAKKPKILAKLGDTYIEEYEFWPLKNDYNPNFLRNMIDIKQGKFIIFESENSDNILTDSLASGTRSGGAVIFYSLPISPKRNLVWVLEDYIKNFEPEHWVYLSSKKSKRISLIKDNNIPVVSATLQQNLELNIMRLNEARKWIISENHSALFLVISRFIQYCISNHLISKQDFYWIMEQQENHK